MRPRAHIGLSLAEKLKDIFSGDKARSTDQVEKTYQGTDDNFFEATNANLRTVLKLDKRNKSYEKDLERFGTRIKLIDVADTTDLEKRREEILPLKKPYRKKCFDEDHEQDLKRFGTHAGIIRVSNDNCKQKKKLPMFPSDFSKAAYQHMMQKSAVKDTSSWSANPFSDIYRDFPKVQINVRNTSEDEKEVILWGANRKAILIPSKPEDVQNHAIIAQVSVPNGVHPQGMAVNPANQCLYITNQLSGTVTVLDRHHQVVRSIQLEPAFPGFTSPVAVTINTNTQSSCYGFAYVACSVSDTIAVIDLAFTVSAVVRAGVRPVAIAFNPANTCVYAANLVSDTITVIDAESFAELSLSPLPAGNDPIGIGIHPVSGEIYIANSLSNTITVYSKLHAFIANVPGVGQYPASVTYSPANNSMYAVSEQSNTISQVNVSEHNVVAIINTGQHPYNSFFNEGNNFVYVQNRGDNSVTVIRPDNTWINGLSFGPQHTGGVFSRYSGSIYISNSATNMINVIGYATANGGIQFNPDYAELLEDLKNSPAIVQHAKFVVTGPERLNTFRLNKLTPTGRQNSKPLSFELYASPQARLNVAEVTELSGTIIDGKMNWQFRLPGLHSVAILIWFRQLDVRDILSPPEKRSIIKTK